MSIKIEEYNKCFKCKHIQKSVYMVLDDEALYSYWCDYMGETKCPNFEEEEL